MDIFDQKAVLNSMVVLRDSREQDTPRARKRYEAFGVPCERATLSFGDYTYNATLPGGEKLYDTSRTVSPTFILERKMNLDELASCFTHSRARFQREFERAIEKRAKIILLVEDATWENLMNGRYRSKFRPEAFFASITAWMVRYDISVVFCKEESSGRIIKELCYRHLKEQLERGVYDRRGDQGKISPAGSAEE